jgi:GntR family transcriptional regulator, transcriptional repressor for pyruvate dehydrogenase complex
VGAASEFSRQVPKPSSEHSPQTRPSLRLSFRGDSAVDVVVSSFRDMIRAGDLKIGDDLPTERALAEKLKVSRNTMREALRRLEAYGIVETRQKRGARVVNRSLDAIMNVVSFRFVEDLDTFRDVQRYRRIVETGLVPDLIERVTPQDLADLREINRIFADPGKPEDLAEADLAFHRRLLEIARNQTSIKVYDVFSTIILQIMTLGKAEDGRDLAMSGHAAIIAALEVKDRAALRSTIEAHMEVGARYLAHA